MPPVSWQIVLALVTAAGGTAPAAGVRPARAKVEDTAVTAPCRSRNRADQLSCTAVADAAARATAAQLAQRALELVDPFADRAPAAPSDPNALVDPFQTTSSR